jgi:hypothetical protein
LEEKMNFKNKICKSVSYLTLLSALNLAAVPAFAGVTPRTSNPKRLKPLEVKGEYLESNLSAEFARGGDYLLQKNIIIGSPITISNLGNYGGDKGQINVFTSEKDLGIAKKYLEQRLKSANTKTDNTSSIEALLGSIKPSDAKYRLWATAVHEAIGDSLTTHCYLDSLELGNLIRLQKEKMQTALFRYKSNEQSLIGALTFSKDGYQQWKLGKKTEGWFKRMPVWAKVLGAGVITGLIYSLARKDKPDAPAGENDQNGVVIGPDNNHF